MNVQSSVSIEIIVPTINNLSEICVQKQNINKNKNKLVAICQTRAPNSSKKNKNNQRTLQMGKWKSTFGLRRRIDHSGSLQVVACLYECLHKMSPK